MNNKSTSDQVVEILKSNHFEQWASKIEKLSLQLNDTSLKVRNSAAIEIEGLCHIRSLGDLNIQSMNGTEWNKKLAKLKKYAFKKKVETS